MKYLAPHVLLFSQMQNDALQKAWGSEIFKTVGIKICVTTMLMKSVGYVNIKSLRNVEMLFQILLHILFMTKAWDDNVLVSLQYKDTVVYINQW